MLKKGFAPCGTDSTDCIQLRRKAEGVSLPSVRRNPEPMGLIPDALYKIERGRVPWQYECFGSIGKKDFLPLLRKSHNGRFPEQTESIQHLGDAAQLTLAAINDHEVRQDCKGGVRLSPGLI